MFPALRLYSRRVRRLSKMIAVAWALLAVPEARAQNTARSNVRTLPYDTRIDGAVTAMGALWLLTSEVLKSELVPEKCRWCYRAADGSSALNSYDGRVRSALVWKDTRTADTASSVIAFVLTPVAGLGLTAVAAGHDGATHGYPVDALVITEATVVAADLNQMVKFAFARERPFVHFLPRAPGGIRALTDTPSDDNLSFFSGHTNLAFAVATASGTVATMRNYRLAPLVWAVGLTSAAAAGYLRIAADKHYLSDVMTGVVVGSLVGVGIPLLFHAAKSAESPPSPSGQALVAPAVRSPLNLTGAW